MKFFAGANTRNGFVSLFDDAFADIDRLYILKGSSGCGKSTLMKRVAAKAHKKGLKTDIIHCSADPESLDGVIIPEIGVAIADGTAPHVLDVKYPCVRETIINLGQFWDENKLLPQRNEIIDLTDKKGEHYKNAYHCLSAIGMASDISDGIISRCTDKTKLDNAAFKLTEKLIGAKQGKRKSIFASSFSAAGYKTLEVFDSVRLLCRLNGRAADMMLLAIEQIAKEQNASIVISHSSLDPKIPDAIFFTESGALVTTLNQPPCRTAEEEKTVSTSRFTDSSKIAEARVRLKGIEKLVHELSSDAQKELTEAKAIHNKIESIYIPAMNFSLLDEYTLDLMKNIFGA